MELTPITQKFVLHWGEMGARWGVNRTVAQIHALLFLAEAPLHAEEIADTLGVARSNVSTSLKELQNWGLVKIIHVMGDRRDHFQAQQEIWEIFHTIVEERRRREIDPTLTLLRECVIDLADERQENTATARKIKGVLEFLEQITHWLDEMKGVSPEMAQKLLQMGRKIQKFL
jgi:DNA-binding transcriptional regulator GbsR (MarR family)